MRLAILPLNATEGTSPAFGRQFSSFVGELLRGAMASVDPETANDINVVSYLAEIEQEGQRRAAFINVAEGLVEYEFIAPLFEQAEVEQVMDGMLAKTDDGFNMVYRFHEKGNETPIQTFDETFASSTIFDQLLLMLKRVAAQMQFTLPAELNDKLPIGTDDPEAFLAFLEGHDAFNYINQSNGAVAMEFSPAPAYAALVHSMEKDPDFLAPYEVVCAIGRSCGRWRIGSFEDTENTLRRAQELAPDDFRAFYSLAEVYGEVGAWPQAASEYEKTERVHEQSKAKAQEENRLEDWMLERASIFSRIGMAQMQQGMPVNAELNFRKAVELEGDDKPSLNLLSQVLLMTNRAHEVPTLWKQQLDRQPTNPEWHARYAIALAQAGREDEAVTVFENALTELEDNTLVKRFYAPVLAQKGDTDRAMDFYEDCLDVAPTDIPLLLEYAQTLQAANREFEVPKVLEDVLNANPDPNTRAQVLAWKTEINEPRRAEAVQNAEQKLERGDAEGAIRELRPLRNWLADYWKMWAVLAAAHNRLEQPDDAQEAAERLLGLFPGCEPGYAELMAALSQKGQFEEAYNVMRYAQAQIPNSLGIAINLALAAKRAGHEDEARALAKQLREAVGNNPELEPVFGELEK